MKDTYLVIAVAAAGLLVGVAGFQLTQQKGYCQKLADQIRQNRTFNGTIACYPPGKIDVNVSEPVENRTELKCVCRKNFMGEISIFTINVAS